MADASHVPEKDNTLARGYVKELVVLLGLTDTRSVMMTRTPGTKATGGNARDALEQLDTFQAATFRPAVWLIG